MTAMMTEPTTKPKRKRKKRNPATKRTRTAPNIATRREVTRVRGLNPLRGKWRVISKISYGCPLGRDSIHVTLTNLGIPESLFGDTRSHIDRNCYFFMGDFKTFIIKHNFFSPTKKHINQIIHHWAKDMGFNSSSEATLVSGGELVALLARAIEYVVRTRMFGRRLFNGDLGEHGGTGYFPVVAEEMLCTYLYKKKGSENIKVCLFNF